MGPTTLERKVECETQFLNKYRPIPHSYTSPPLSLPLHQSTSAPSQQPLLLFPPPGTLLFFLPFFRLQSPAYFPLLFNILLDLTISRSFRLFSFNFRFPRFYCLIFLYSFILFIFHLILIIYFQYLPILCWFIPSLYYTIFFISVFGTFVLPFNIYGFSIRSKEWSHFFRIVFRIFGDFVQSLRKLYSFCSCLVYYYKNQLIFFANLISSVWVYVCIQRMSAENGWLFYNFIIIVSASIVIWWIFL